MIDRALILFSEHIEYENYYMTQSSQRTTPLTTGPISMGAPIQTHSTTPAAARGRRPAAALPSIPTPTGKVMVIVIIDCSVT